MEWRLEGKRVSTISPLSSYSPRGPLDDRLLKTSIYSDSDTDLASQAWNLFPAVLCQAISVVYSVFIL